MNPTIAWQWTAMLSRLRRMSSCGLLRAISAVASGVRSWGT